MTRASHMAPQRVRPPLRPTIFSPSSPPSSLPSLPSSPPSLRPPSPSPSPRLPFPSSSSSWFAPPTGHERRTIFQERCVHEIRCLHCNDVKSHRGMEAVCLTTSEKKFSTDAPPRRISVPQHCEMVVYCRCLASEVYCTVCGNCVGYVVVVPCSRCSSKNNNRHRYIFDISSVIAAPLEGIDGHCTWSALAPPWQGDIFVGR